MAANYNTSFVVNLGDLNKILEQIKIAERNAAGESLVDIIGSDAALLPMGLRTVDGSFNHLLPGQENAGAADQIFPRLLTPVFINDQDGDFIAFGPPGAPVVTNTNYDPTTTSSSNPVVPGVNVHDVADADPRIISNLIVDQTLNNRSALIAALVVAGSEDAYGEADAILAARGTFLTHHANEKYYETAIASSTNVQARLSVALNELAAVRAAVGDGVAEAADITNTQDALTAAMAARDAQIAIVAALQKIGAPPELAAADSLRLSLLDLVAELQTVRADVNDGSVLNEEFGRLVDAQNHASQLLLTSTSNHSALVASEHTAELAAAAASTVLDGLIQQYDIEITADGSVIIENRSPDIGLSPPNSEWMTFFGQFFDHGLDLVTKGNNGTVYIPLANDDPLVAGADHVFGTADDLPPSLRFMTLSRVTPFGENGTESQNTTTPFVDQNQTYTSNASHQVFLREYKLYDKVVDIDHDGDLEKVHAVNTGHLLNGARGGIANWAEVKAQAITMLGLKLSDIDVLDVPELEVDAYGNFVAGPNGFAQVHLNVQLRDANGSLTDAPGGPFMIEGVAGGLDLHSLPNLNLPAVPGFTYVVSIKTTGHAFLNDIAHNAVPVMVGGHLNPDADTDIGNAVANDGHGHNTEYDNELLDRHFVTGDGRGNENIGLTAVHTIFHSEHNRLVEAYKHTILASGDLSTINEWLLTDLTNVNQIPTSQAGIDALDWDGGRLFQAGRFVTEMQYQHLVFEEFARRIQPNVDPFVFTNSADLDPAIIAEFAHTVYRFGHSMLTDTVDRLDNSLNIVGGDQQVGLIEAFLNPQLFTASGIDDETATGALIRGMTRQVGSEIDEFVVEALRNNLLGLPLDLPALNLARGRDTGIPSLNESRSQIYSMTGAADLKPYTSWLDYAQHIKHPLSIVNFIAAYGTHQAITTATTLEAKREAAMLLVVGDGAANDTVDVNGNPVERVLINGQFYTDRLDFINARGAHAGGALGGLNNVDLWIGGLAEELNEFGGQLGSTFNFIFEYQMEHLQNGDRFYYLSRTQGMNLLNLLEPNTFTDLVMRNTDLGDIHSTHLSGELMEVADMILELDREAGQANYSGIASRDGTDPADRSLLDPTHDDPFLQAIDPKVLRVEGQQRFLPDGVTPALDADGKAIFDGGILKFSGGEHVVLGGTEGNDFLYGDKGIDTLWGDAGDDYLNAGMESDQVFGGDGDDIIEDPFGDNFLRGEAGHDVISSDSGLSLLFGGEGQDFLEGVTDIKEFFAGPGNDFLLGGTDSDNLMGNEGDDWIEGGEGFDGISGGNSELFFNSIIDGHDILNGQGNDTDYDGENGDDIMVDGPGIQRNNGMDGFDWTIFKGDNSPVDADLGIRPFDTRQALILRDRFDSVEGLSGWKNNDILTGASKILLGEGFADQLTQAGVDRINGMREFLGPVLGADTGNPNDVVFESDINASGEIILGGGGSDTIRGNLGDDILDGDAWLNVRISVRAGYDAAGPIGGEILTFDGLAVRKTFDAATMRPEWQQLDVHGVGTGLTKTLSEMMHARIINPGQLQAVREILDGNVAGDRDIAVFSDIRTNYTIETVNGVIGDADGDGFITVAHTPVVGAGGGAAAAALRDSDGTDKIRNFEILSFADGNIFLDTTIDNTPATGLLSISIITDLAPPGANVGDTFRADLGTVADSDGLPAITAFTFTWEFEATPGAGDWTAVTDPVTGDPIVGRTFTPTPAFELDGLRLRVVGRFSDAEGIPEAVVSTATAQLAAQAVATATAGDDVLVGTNGPDFINALAGDDTVTALGGDDVVIGGPGSDIVDGGLGTDTAVFFGPLANFTFALTPEGQLQVVDAATADEDTVIDVERLVFIDATGPLTDAEVQTILNGGAVAGVTAVQTLLAADILAGTFINDGNAGNTLTGTEFDDVIFGNGGDDIIDGLGGDDLLVGGNGDDDIDSGGDNDIVSGGDSTAVGNTIRLRTGNETLLVALNETGSDTVRNDGGTETLSIGARAVVDIPNQTGNVVAAPGAIAGLSAVDDGAGNLVVTVNNKTVTITDHFNDPDSVLERVNFNGSSFDGLSLGTADYNLVAAATGVTTLSGGAIADALFGTGADDTLSGNGGNDLLLGGAGNDLLNGGAGDDAIDGGAGNADTAAFSGVVAGNTYSIDAGRLVVSGPDGVDTLTGVERLQFGANTFTLRQGTNGGETLNGNANADIVIAGGGADTVNAGGGDDVVFGGAGGDTISGDGGSDIIDGEAGNDTISGGAGADTITWNIDDTGPGGGRDLVNGNGGTDTFVVDGNSQNEVYRIFSNTDDADGNALNGIQSSAAAAGLTGLAAGTQIVVTRNTNGAGSPVTNANIIAELSNIEEIVVNTRGGTNVVTPVGNFNGTTLLPNTITVNDDGGNTTVDVTQLTSPHHIAFHTSGGNDTIIGARPQDQVIPDGGTGGGTGGGGNGGGGNGGGGDDVVGNGDLPINASDIAAIKNLIHGLQGGEDNDAVGIRDLEGTGNNRAHPDFGSADQPFIRITDAHYGAYDPATGNNAINPLFAGLDPRAISNALGTQEAGLPTASSGVNSLFTAFGQYFDHGLDFLGKGGNGSIQIGAPGAGHTPGTDNPADLTRGTVDSIVGGVPQHLNKTSPFADQNQAYGSDELVGQFLREGDGHGGFSGRLLAGVADPSNPDFKLLPNLRELIQHHWENNTVFTKDDGSTVAFRTYFAGLVNASGVINEAMVPGMVSNFMGSGFPLLLDTNPFINLLDHYVAGDGRANENIGLTAMHTIWARNHNYLVEKLLDNGFTGTSEDLFQAAKLINEAEYQRVVYTEFADHLLGGMRGAGEHGFDEYNPNADARVSHEFATAAYRFGHSLINQTMTVLDANGNPTSVSLFDAFLNPTNDASAFTVDPTGFYTPKPGYEQLGINGILGGAITQGAEEVDVNIVDAVRNDLVRTSADVFALDVARTWDVGLGSLNQVRADLLASTDPYVREAVSFAGNLTPYTSWEDFQARNNLSDAVINQFKQAYPDLELAAADIAAFQAINPGIVLGGPNHNIVKGIDRVDLFVGGLAETHINGGVVGQTFWAILHEQLDRIQEGDRLYYLDRVENLDFYDTVEEEGFASIIARNTGLTGLPEDIFGTNSLGNNDDDDGAGTGNNDDDDDTDTGNDDDDDDAGNGNDDDDDDGDSDSDGDTDTGGGTTVPTSPVIKIGTPQPDVLAGGTGDDNLVGLGGDDAIVGDAGADALSAGEGHDLVNGGAGRDVIFAGSGDDQVFGGSEADIIYGEAGLDRLFGDAGNDMITAGAGDDSVFGGAGDDLFVAEIGDGNDVYFGDDIDGGTGKDTLDMSAVTADVTVNLGSGSANFAHGSASSIQTGNDTIWGIENVNTGSGNDTISASNAVNVMNGGSGNDTYKFATATAANGDTILGFSPGDKIDLSAIDANTGTPANDAFTLVTGAAFTAAGQLLVSYETNANGEFTVIQGNVNGDTAADFTISVEGHHTINSSNVIV